MDNTLRIRSPEGRASLWVPSALRHHLPKQEASSECPREPQVLGARVPDRGPEGTISVSYSFEALNAVSSPVPKATSSGRLLKTRHLPSRHIPPPGTCTPLRPKPPLS